MGGVAGGKVMRGNEPVLLVLSTYDGKLFLRKVKFYLRNVKYCFHSRSGSDPHLHGLARTTLWRRTVERVPLWGVAARFLWCGAHCIAAATAGIAALRVPVWGTVPGREYVLVRSLLEFEQALDAHDPSDGDDGWDDAQWGARFACAFSLLDPAGNQWGKVLLLDGTSGWRFSFWRWAVRCWPMSLTMWL